MSDRSLAKFDPPGDILSEKNNQTLSVNQRGSYTPKKSFDLQSAFDKRVINNHTNAEKFIKKKCNFINCCMISINKDNKSKINADTVYKAIKEALSPEELALVQTIGHYSSTKNWIIEFKNPAAYLSSLNRKITLEGTSFYLNDANKFFANNETPAQKASSMIAFIRVHWLPPTFNARLIESHLKKELKCLTSITEIRKEKMSQNTSINNNVFRVKVTFETNDSGTSFEKIKKYMGSHKVDGFEALFQLSGMPPKCLYCNEYGHMRGDCPNKVKCTKCFRNTHTSEQCNMAKRLLPELNDNLLDYEEDELMEESVTHTISKPYDYFMDEHIEPHILDLNAPHPSSNVEVINSNKVALTVVDKFKIPYSIDQIETQTSTAEKRDLTADESDHQLETDTESQSGTDQTLSGKKEKLKIPKKRSTKSTLAKPHQNEPENLENKQAAKVAKAKLTKESNKVKAQLAAESALAKFDLKKNLKFDQMAKELSETNAAAHAACQNSSRKRVKSHSELSSPESKNEAKDPKYSANHDDDHGNLSEPLLN